MDSSTMDAAKLTHNEREAILAAAKASKSHESFLAEVTGGGNHPAIVATEVTPSGASVAWVDWSKVAEDYHAVLRGVDAAITAIGGNPESTAWGDWDIADLLRLGDAARHVREAYGAKLTVKPKARGKGGRPRIKLDDQTLDEARSRLRRGVDSQTVADLAGISQSTLKRLKRDFEF